MSHPTPPSGHAQPTAGFRFNVSTVPLNQLVLSPTNVRKTPATAAEDAELEASIRARGIKQNLIVHPTPIDGKGVYAVDAGGRRLKVLQKLAAEGVIDADHQVPCKVEQPDDALETSLWKTRSAPRCTRPTNSSPWRR